MSENLCRWCGCEAPTIDAIDDPVGRRHESPAICQALLLRKLVDHLVGRTPVAWYIPALGREVTAEDIGKYVEHMKSIPITYADARKP